MGRSLLAELGGPGRTTESSVAHNLEGIWSTREVDEAVQLQKEIVVRGTFASGVRYQVICSAIRH